MKLSDKIRYLREVEGSLRGLGRGDDAAGVAAGDQCRDGARRFRRALSFADREWKRGRTLTNNARGCCWRSSSRCIRATLVDDPEGYHAELPVPDLGLEDKLDLWLIGGAERFRRDPELRRALLAVAKHSDSRCCLLLLESILETPQLAERLLELLRPGVGTICPPAQPQLIARPAAGLSSAAKKSSSKPMSKDLKGAKR